MNPRLRRRAAERRAARNFNTKYTHAATLRLLADVVRSNGQGLECSGFGAEYLIGAGLARPVWSGGRYFELVHTRLGLGVHREDERRLGRAMAQQSRRGPISASAGMLMAKMLARDIGESHA